MMRKQWSMAAIGLMACTLWACGEQEQPDVPAANFLSDAEEFERYDAMARTRHQEQSTIVAPWATMLTKEQARDVDLTEDGLVMPESEITKDLTKKDIVFAPHHDIGKAFLRRIESIERKDGMVHLKTRPAAITEVVFKGSMSDMPTEMNPYTEGEEVRTQGQEIGFSSIFPTSSTQPPDPNNDFNGHPGISGRFFMEVEGPSVAANASLDMDARISSSWYRNIFGYSANVRVGGSPATQNEPRYRIYTSCSTVINGLEFIKGSSADQRECKSAYSEWADSPSYPQIPSSLCSGSNIDCDTSGGAPRMRCRDSIDWWPDDWVTMPYPEQADWAKDECRGTLEYFNMEAGIAPTMGLRKFRLGLEGGYARELLPRAFTRERDDYLTKDTWKVFFIGWFPVAIRFEGKLIANFWKFNAKGTMTFGFDNINVSLGGADLRLRYNGGGLDQEGAWSGGVDLTGPSISGEPKWEGSLEGGFEREFFGAEGGIYLYDLVGPYVVPAALYGRVTGAVANNPNTCNFGIAGGLKGEVGIKGKVPFTNIEKNWKLGEYDSCGSSPSTSIDYYEEDVRFCVKHCANVVPLNIELNWRDAADLDLIVTLPDGTEVSYASTDSLVPFRGQFNNNGSCPRNQCNSSGDWKEFLRFYSVDEVPQGTYRIKVRNFADSDASFEIKVTGEDAQQREYISETFSGSAPGERGESREFTINVRTPM